MRSSILQELTTKCLTSSSSLNAAFIDSLNSISYLTLSQQSELNNSEFLEQVLSDIAAHHAVSSYPYSKEKFEFSLQKAFFKCGLTVEMPEAKNNPSYDLTITSPNLLKVSCKSEASTSASANKVKVAKWKELNKWKGDGEVPKELVNEFFNLVSKLDKVYMLRCLHFKNSNKSVNHFKKLYEVLEIPVSLIQSLEGIELTQKTESQNYYIEKQYREGLVQAQFIGGGEKKLALNLDKSLCISHFSFVIDIKDPLARITPAKTSLLSIKSTNHLINNSGQEEPAEQICLW